jgi:hypothetical protein
LLAPFAKYFFADLQAVGLRFANLSRLILLHSTAFIYSKALNFYGHFAQVAERAELRRGKLFT